MSPKVYLIGRSQFDVETFLSFLHNQSMDWRRSPQTTEAESNR